MITVPHHLWRSRAAVPARARAGRTWALLAASVAVVVAFAMTTSGAGAADSNTLSVKAGEYTYKLSGKPKAGWVKVDFDNAGVEDHMMAVVELKRGVTAKQLEQAAMSNDESGFAAIAAPGASPNGPSGMPDLVGPGQETATIAKLKAGHYGMLCFVPAPDGTPHFMKGMVDTFDVKKGKSSLKPPIDGVTKVSLTDTAIDFPTDDVGRTLTLKVANTGTTPHGLTFVKINDGKTLDDVKAWFDAFLGGQKPAGEAPGVIVGGVSSVDPGSTAYVEQSLTAGHYGYLSTQGEAPNDDYAKGLKGEFDVK
jgi:hypothetical protein